MVIPTRLQQFTRDYNLPLIATAVLVAVILGVVGLRSRERSALVGILPESSDRSRDYAQLLSNDRVDKPAQDSQNEPAQDTPVSTDTPFTINPSVPPPPPSDPGGGAPPPLPPPFLASISYFRHEGSFMECSPSSGSGSWREKCSKRHIFKAAIGTTNGPGTVSYDWRSSHPPANESNSFSVGGGDTFTPLQKSVVLPCNQTLDFTMQLAITNPNSVLSHVITVKHKCENPGS